MKLSGLMVTHQCEKFDYCYREALNSLIHVCDEVVVVDAASTDGTRDVLTAYQGPKFKIIDAQWSPVVSTEGQWLSDLYNLAKNHASHQFQLGLQADEVLNEVDRKELRRIHRPTSFKRLNFWKDAQHYLSGNQAVNSRVFRFGPKAIKFVRDAESMEHVRRDDSEVCIFHYGFLRKTEALIEKSITVEDEFFGVHNPVFDRMKEEGRKPFDEYFTDLIQYDGPHPKFAEMWLQDRGYDSKMYIAARFITPFIQKDWIGVEIGVFMADSSRFLLQNCAFMYLIDPCMSYQGNPDVGVYSVEEGVKGKLKPYESRYKFIKGMSHDVHEQIPEVDFVFIDGNHTYDYVKRDIELYWPKVKSGGFISGHDYGPGFQGLVRAVNEFGIRMNLKVERYADDWLIHKP